MCLYLYNTIICTDTCIHAFFKLGYSQPLLNSDKLSDSSCFIQGTEIFQAFGAYKICPPNFSDQKNALLKWSFSSPMFNRNIPRLQWCPCEQNSLGLGTGIPCKSSFIQYMLIFHDFSMGGTPLFFSTHGRHPQPPPNTPRLGAACNGIVGDAKEHPCTLSSESLLSCLGLRPCTSEQQPNGKNDWW